MASRDGRGALERLWKTLAQPSVRETLLTLTSEALRNFSGVIHRCSGRGVGGGGLAKEWYWGRPLGGRGLPGVRCQGSAAHERTPRRRTNHPDPRPAKRHLWRRRPREAPGISSQYRALTPRAPTPRTHSLRPSNPGTAPVAAAAQHPLRPRALPHECLRRGLAWSSALRPPKTQATRKPWSPLRESRPDLPAACGSGVLLGLGRRRRELVRFSGPALPHASGHRTRVRGQGPLARSHLTRPVVIHSPNHLPSHVLTTVRTLWPRGKGFSPETKPRVRGPAPGMNPAPRAATHRNPRRTTASRAGEPKSPGVGAAPPLRAPPLPAYPPRPCTAPALHHSPPCATPRHRLPFLRSRSPHVPPRHSRSPSAPPARISPPTPGPRPHTSAPGPTLTPHSGPSAPTPKHPRPRPITPTPPRPTPRPTRTLPPPSPSPFPPPRPPSVAAPFRTVNAPPNTPPTCTPPPLTRITAAQRFTRSRCVLCHGGVQFGAGKADVRMAYVRQGVPG